MSCIFGHLYAKPKHWNPRSNPSNCSAGLPNQGGQTPFSIYAVWRWNCYIVLWTQLCSDFSNILMDICCVFPLKQIFRVCCTATKSDHQCLLPYLPLLQSKNLDAAPTTFINTKGKKRGIFFASVIVSIILVSAKSTNTDKSIRTTLCNV